MLFGEDPCFPLYVLLSLFDGCSLIFFWGWDCPSEIVRRGILRKENKIGLGNDQLNGRNLEVGEVVSLYQAILLGDPSVISGATGSSNDVIGGDRDSVKAMATVVV